MGERLEASTNIQLVVDAAERAIAETIPQAVVYKDLWVQKVVLHPSIERIQEEERAVRPIQPLLIPKALVIAGFPQQALDRYHYQVSHSNPFFTNYDKQRLHTIEGFAKGLRDADPDIQLKIGVMVGFNLIDANIRSIAHRLYPQIQGDERNDYWRMMMKTAVIDFAQAERRRFKTKKAYQDFKDRVGDLFSEKGLKKEEGIIEAVGGLVICRFPGQSTINPEIRIGTPFDNGTLRSITFQAKARFTSLFFGRAEVAEGSSEIDMEDLLDVSASQKEAETVLQILGLHRYEVQKGKKVIIKDESFEAFAFSQLPRLYNESEDPRLNPFNYAEIVEERDWLRR